MGGFHRKNTVPALPFEVNFPQSPSAKLWGAYAGCRARGHATMSEFRVCTTWELKLTLPRLDRGGSLAFRVPGVGHFPLLERRNAVRGTVGAPLVMREGHLFCLVDTSYTRGGRLRKIVLCH